MSDEKEQTVLCTFDPFPMVRKIIIRTEKGEREVGEVPEAEEGKLVFIPKEKK